MSTKQHENLLHKELSYQIQGAAIEVRKNFGPGLKESIYQSAFAEELKSRNLRFEKEKSIQIFSPKTGKFIGSYRPDFIVDGKILVELKAVEKIPKMFLDQLYSYLRNSKYELGYFINFASPRLYIKRIIFTNNRKPFLRIAANFLVLLSLIFVLFSVSPSVRAAELYLESSKNEYYTQETFIIDVRIDVEHNESINAIEGYLEFPNNILEVKDFSTGNSILTFIEEPKIDQGKGLISFVGIIPGGYGGRIPGDPGKSNLLARIIFQAISSGSAKITFEDNSQTLLSDGKGTSAKLTTKGVIIEVQPPVEVQPQKDEWQEELEKDKIPPEDFKPEIVKIDDKYYLAFTVKDKDSGIDYYAIRETTRKKEIARIDAKKWIEAESPYLLKDQKLSSYVYIKAVDKAGNERIVELPATYPLPWYKNYFIWVIIILVISLAITKNLWKKLLIHK